MVDHEPHSNPLAPSDDEMDIEEKPKEKLNNADFRKLMMTPMVCRGVPITPQTKQVFTNPEPKDAKAEKKKKKIYYAQFKKNEAEKEKEAASKYRDRAKERREGIVKFEDANTTSDYNAVAPTAMSSESREALKQKAIEDSKYLGGDVEHTHLVKGLDYVLLEKRKAEIAAEEREKMAKDKKKMEEEKKNEGAFKTKMGTSVVKIALSANDPAVRNDNFLPRRMVYVFDLEDPEEQCPVTLIRSKADLGLDASLSISDNDIVINKLIQTVSNLRKNKENDKRKKDKKDKDSQNNGGHKIENIDMFSLDMNYKPTDYHRTVDVPKPDGEGRRSYFINPLEDETKIETQKINIADLINSVNGQDITEIEDNETKSKRNKASKLFEYDHYGECYPGMSTAGYVVDGIQCDAGGDTDEEADYTQMDQGKRRGSVGRWDFDTHEEYGDYMSNKEAMPKAAFQFGVKMGDGRKTRRSAQIKNKINRDKKSEKEWAQISEILNKRKADSDVNADARKKIKY